MINRAYPLQPVINGSATDTIVRPSRRDTINFCRIIRGWKTPRPGHLWPYSLSLSLSFSLSLSIYLSICLSIYLSIYLFIYLTLSCSLSLSLSLSLIHISSLPLVWPVTAPPMRVHRITPSKLLYQRRCREFKRRICSRRDAESNPLQTKGRAQNGMLLGFMDGWIHDTNCCKRSRYWIVKCIVSCFAALKFLFWLSFFFFFLLSPFQP